MMKLTDMRLRWLLVCFASVGLSYTHVCPAQTLPPITISPAVDQACSRLLAAPALQKVLADVRADDRRVLQEHRHLSEIPAPPFKEKARADYFVSRLKALGLSNAYIDSEGNAIGLRQGRGNGPTLVFTAHLDTFFPEGTDVRVTERDGRLYGPGMGEDARGLAVLLSSLKILQDNKLPTVGDILFVASVGEEQLGNLRGMKALFSGHPEIDGMVGLEFSMSKDAELVSVATASHRYDVSFSGPGGPSFTGFGLPSAIHAMGRAIGRISDVRPPLNPRTTFTVGTVGGGTSVNWIASDARMSLEIRSNAMSTLAETEKNILAAVAAGVTDENNRWNNGSITYQTQLIGDRPAGQTPSDSVILQAATKAVTSFEETPPRLKGASTDGNLPMSLGIPTVVMGNGGLTGGFHSPNEWFDPKNEWVGAQAALATVLELVGVDGITEPLLVKRAGAK